jgi:hypothetical protein
MGDQKLPLTIYLIERDRVAAFEKELSAQSTFELAALRNRLTPCIALDHDSARMVAIPTNRYSLFERLKPPPLALGRARSTPTCHARCHPLQPHIPDRFALCPFRESVGIWFPCLVEGTNSQLTERTKKMNSENIKKVTNQAIEQLIAALTRAEAKR